MQTSVLLWVSPTLERPGRHSHAGAWERCKNVLPFNCRNRQFSLNKPPFSLVGWATLFCPPFTNNNGGQKSVAHPTKVLSFPHQCRSGFATPIETFDDCNSFQNVSDGGANPVTLRSMISPNVTLLTLQVAREPNSHKDAIIMTHYNN